MLTFLIFEMFISILVVKGEMPCENGKRLLLDGTCAPSDDEIADSGCPSMWHFRENLSKARSQLEAARALTCEDGGTQACWECPWIVEPAELHGKLQEVLEATQALSEVWQKCSPISLSQMKRPEIPIIKPTPPQTVSVLNIATGGIE